MDETPILQGVHYIATSEGGREGGREIYWGYQLHGYSIVLGSSNQLGELFDHGCDALSTFLIAVSGVSAIGMQDRPVTMLAFVVLLEQVNFAYHWEAYVSGVLHFNL